MYSNFNRLWLCLLLLVSAHAEHEEGGVRIANALARGSGPLRVIVDGKPWNQRGFMPGDVSGALILAAGAHQLQLARDGLVSGEVQVVVEPEKVGLLVPYAEPVDGTELWRIRVLKLDSHGDDATRTGSLISVSSMPFVGIEVRNIAGSWESLRLERCRVRQLAILQPRGYVHMRVGQRDLSSLPVASSGHHVVIFYDDVEGCVQNLSFRDHSWIRPD